MESINNQLVMNQLATKAGIITPFFALNNPRWINHIATVLAELQEGMKQDQLLALAKNQPARAWKQRLGYLLEVVDAIELAEILKK